MTRMTRTPALPDDLLAEMDRLGQRPYSQIGVPMYLVVEDLTGTCATPGADGDPALAEAFRASIARVIAERGDVQPADIARVIEVLADRTFLDRPFSELTDTDTA